MTNTCPACGQQASGRFCSSCGTSLEAAVACAECGNELPPGGRFCNQCGAPTPATEALLAQRSASAKSPLPWVGAGIGGAAAVALVLVLVTRGGDEEVATAAPAAPFANGPVGDPSQVDLSSMTPRERADRLFTRIMTAAEAGDSAQARSFLPMALAAYQMVPDVDADARYHVAVLSLLGGDPATSRAQADTILAGDPDHLLGLHTAAAAEQARGNDGAARQLFQRFLDAYDGEIAKARPEYEAHAPALTSMRQEASRAVDSL